PIRGPAPLLMAFRSTPLERSRSAIAMPRNCSGVRGRCGGVPSKTVGNEPRRRALRKGSAAFAGDFAPADIAAGKAFRPINRVHASISTMLRLLHAGTERRHIEHAPAIGNQTFPVALCSGVEDCQVL